MSGRGCGAKRELEVQEEPKSETDDSETSGETASTSERSMCEVSESLSWYCGRDGSMLVRGGGRSATTYEVNDSSVRFVCVLPAPPVPHLTRRRRRTRLVASHILL